MKSARVKRRQTPSISELESGEASSSSHLCSTEAISQESITFYSSMIRIFTQIMGSFQNLCKESTIGHLYWMMKIVEKRLLNG